MTLLRKLDPFKRFLMLVATLRSAATVASAVENGRNPDARDLRVLGIDPAMFPLVGAPSQSSSEASCRSTPSLPRSRNSSGSSSASAATA